MSIELHSVVSKVVVDTTITAASVVEKVSEELLSGAAVVIELADSTDPLDSILVPAGTRV